MILRVSIGGSRVRIRISNAYGILPLAIGTARIALRDTGPSIVPASSRQLRFGGAMSGVIAPGAVLCSDPVDLDVPALADLAVSIHLPQDLPPSFGITGRYARQTNYISPPGDLSAEIHMRVGRITDDWYFLCGVDVLAPSEARGIVAMGDSLTDANISTHDGHHSWPSQLARRLVAKGGRPTAVMNQGLGGNRLLHDGRGDNGLKRFDRDVIAQPGVTHAIVMLGTNDVRNRSSRLEEEVGAEEIIAGLHQLALRGRSKGIRMFCCTLIPFGHETYPPRSWNLRREAVREAVNEWLREGDAFDAVIDFDRVLRDPKNPINMLAEFDCGDRLHPSDLGYRAMGDAIDLSLFD